MSKSTNPSKNVDPSYTEWARTLECITSVEIPLENMCEGENSRETTEFGIFTCAKRILERGWIQTSPFVWKWRTQEDADRFSLTIPTRIFMFFLLIEITNF